MTTNALRVLASLVVALLLLAAGSVSSSAQDIAEPDTDALEVSRDGLQWSDAITTPLFDPALRWVPGDVRTARFFVRNNREESGDLQVVIDRTISEALRDTGFLEIAARVGNGQWLEVAAGGRQVLVDTDSVGSTQQMGVQLRASLDYAAPNRTMILASDLDLTITLTQDGIVRDATSGPDSQPFPGFGSGSGGSDGPGTVDSATGELPGAGGLPDTGSPLRPWVLPLALTLLAFGAVLVARRREEDAPQNAREPLTRS